jgi:hypothetical protein
MRRALIINSVVCLAGVMVGTLFAGASIISIANMKVSWAAALLVAAFLVPISFVISGIGAWLAYHWNLSKTAIGLIALPWVYTALFVVAMLLSFPQ